MNLAFVMNKRIAVIVDDFPSKGRPVFVFVQQLVFAMVDQGADITVVAPQSLTHALFRGEKLRPLMSTVSTSNRNAFQVYRPYSISFGLRRKWWLYKIAMKFNIKVLTDRLKAIKPDILYGHFWHSAYKVMDYAIDNNLPVFVACGEGDDALEDLVASMNTEQKEKLSNTVKGVICVSTENKRKCLQFGLSCEENTIVLPNCVDESLFRPADGSLIRKELGIEPEDFVVSFTGAFIKRKGSRVLSEAVKKLSDQRIKLIFMGKPLKGDDCTPDCSGIVYMSSTEHDLMPKYLNASDVFVLPTLKEGCCNAIVEALACGIPVISSNRPFNDDILNEGNSLVVDPEDVNSVADAIAEMKRNSDLYSAKKKYAMEHANQYSITDRARKILKFIKDLI